MSLSQLYLYAIVVLLVYATLWYILALLLKRNDIADVAWGLGFIVMVIVGLVFCGLNPTALVLSALVIIWGVRLSTHIALRMQETQEDFRYAQWRKEWGKSFYWRTYVQVFLLQGIILLIVAAPVFIAFANGKELHSEVSIIGIVIWLIGFLVQSIADAQLAKFKKQKRPGEIMDKGLWKYSRHPNYFGELVMWWGLFLVVLPLQYGWVGVISPLTITYLLNYVSGVPMLEKRFDKNENYQRYKAQTSRLIPLMKKKVHE